MHYLKYQEEMERESKEIVHYVILLFRQIIIDVLVSIGNKLNTAESLTHITHLLMLGIRLLFRRLSDN